MIPRYEPTYSFTEIHQSFLQALRNNRTDILEASLREYFKVKHVFLMRSGRSSLFVILKALNKPGKVLMPAYNCRNVPESAWFAGYSPMLLDPDLETLNVPPERYLNRLTEDVSAIFAISLFGIPYDVRPLVDAARHKGILLVEDAATAMGSRVGGRLTGTIGDVGVISFQDTKLLSAHTGGVIITNNDQIAQKIAAFLEDVPRENEIWRNYLSTLFHKAATRHWVYPFTQFAHRVLNGEAMYEIVSPPMKTAPGYLARCSAFSTGLIMNQWRNLDWNISRRRWIAAQYKQALAGREVFRFPTIADEIEPVWIQYPLLIERKFEFYKYMQKRGVDITWSHRYSCAEEFHQDDCPTAEIIARSILSLPCHPGLSDVEVEKICQIAQEYINKFG